MAVSQRLAVFQRDFVSVTNPDAIFVSKPGINSHYCLFSIACRYSGRSGRCNDSRHPLPAVAEAAPFMGRENADNAPMARAIGDRIAEAEAG